MAKIQRTITVEVCDRCGKEGGVIGECCICQKELCSNCDQILTITVELGKGQGLVYSLYSSLHHEGLRAKMCIDHAQEAARVLRGAGFKDFSYDVEPV